jgi:hypothetical protein
MRAVLRFGLGVALALGTVGVASAANVPAASSPGTAMPLSTASTTVIQGDNAGAFSFYRFDYPGQDIPGTLTITYRPSDPVTANAVGVNLYQGGALLASSTGVSSTPGTVTVDFSSATAGPVLVQVYNYLTGEPVSFQLALSPLAAPAPAAPAPAPASATGSESASSADHPVSLAEPATGMLTGRTAGAYAYYTLPYPGDGSTQSVQLVFSPAGSNVSDGVYLNLYQNGAQLASVNATQAATPGVLVVPFSSSTAGPVLVQVANYTDGLTTGYTLSH